MLRILTVAAAVVLVLHGLIHLMGTAAYMRLAEVEGLPYKTALLGGAWEVGEAGMRIFGALWAVAAAGFLVAAAAWFFGVDAWPALLLAVTGLSLALTALDYSVAFMGVAVNVAIIAAIAVVPRLLPAAAAG